MKPKQINVFDGLRITTEHVDHLQGAFLTGLQDLREATGLGKVVRGFEVHVEADNQIVIQPGLAYDREGNRIVSDEPQKMNIVFQEGKESVWVTIRYDQFEHGEIEGKNTLIWDSCLLGLSPDVPDSSDLSLAIARLDRVEDGSLVVNSLTSRPLSRVEDSIKTGTTQNKEAASITTGVGVRLSASQRIIRFSVPAGPSDNLLKSLAAVVRTQSETVKKGLPDPSLTLATIDIDVPFSPVSLSCQTVISTSIADEEGENRETPAAIVPHIPLSTSWGEASFSDEIMLQHALVLYSGEFVRPALPVEGLIAQLPLYAWLEVAPEDKYAACSYLQLAVGAKWASLRRITFNFTMEWKGGYAENRIRILEGSTYRFQTEALMAWKAIGSA